MATIGLVAYWSMGEVGPFVRLGKALQMRGHRVLLVTQGPYAEVARKHGLEARALDTPEQFAAYAEDAELFNSPQGIHTLYQRHFLPLVSRELALLEEVTKAEDSILICRSTPGIAARLLSERDSCPLVPVLPGMSHLHTLSATFAKRWGCPRVTIGNNGYGHLCDRWFFGQSGLTSLLRIVRWTLRRSALSLWRWAKVKNSHLSLLVWQNKKNTLYSSAAGPQDLQGNAFFRRPSKPGSV